MSQTMGRAARFLPTLAIYSLVIIVALGLAVWRYSNTAEGGRTSDRAQSEARNVAGARAGGANTKPFFSLSTGRTYASDDRARLWVDYRNVNELDFRVYRVNDPVEFFKGLDDPHRMGEDERRAVAAARRQKPSLLERLRAFKSWFNTSVKTYVRGQLRRESRRAFNAKFRADDETGDRLPLNVADYARVPLLNPDQLVSSWRQRLAPLEDEYDRRMVSLGKREPGVYLVEAIGANDLRAYTVAVVTDLTMISKTTRDGEVMIYAVNRKTGAPRAGVNVEVVKGRRALASGATDRSGILKAGIDKKANTGDRANTPPAESGEEADDAEASPDSYLIMARERDNFAISDLDSFYFGGGEGDSDNSLIGYIYTDRPVYRPAQKIYFKGVLRRRGDEGYEMIGARSVNVSVEDPNGGKIFERVLPLSPRGTFSGEVETAAEAPLGNYRVIAQISEQTASSYFEVEEYKKPEYKVQVTATQKFVPTGAEAKFSVEARYFFGAPVADAEVKYYVYRSRHYHAWLYGGGEDDADGFGTNESTEEDDEWGSYGYATSEMVREGEGTLDERGRMSVTFQVPEAGENDSWDYSYRLEAQVTDASRRTMQGSASFTGTRGQYVAYAAPERYVYTKGDTAKIAVKAGDYEGRAVTTKVTLRFVEQHYEKVKRKTEDGYEYDDYERRERELEKSAEVMTDAAGMASYDYYVPVSGYIYVNAVVAGEGG
nr:hypothetical protein [Pyrinomonadaceae bacterium]